MYSLGGQALAKRRKTTAERKAEDAQKRAEREGADPDEPWSLQVGPPALLWSTAAGNSAKLKGKRLLLSAVVRICSCISRLGGRLGV